MTEADLDDARRVCDAAFGGARDEAAETDPPSIFSEGLFALRFAADPDGCFVAVGADGATVGCVISVARGTLGWFGPLATLPSVQRSGAGESLIRSCLDGWDRRGVTLRGLETMGESPFHVGFYGRFGFRPAWTGVAFERAIEPSDMPDGVEVGGRVPDLDFIYPGLDVSGEVWATTSTRAGWVVTTDDGVALVHIERTLQGSDTAFVPFLAATTRAGFDRLMGAAEHLGSAAGKSSLFTRTSGSAWATSDALVGRGYRPGGAFVRMKSGDGVDYDRGDVFYLDNWL
ncbi:MAG: GNAT family N-acetyltransferase [Acidimicrobiales bacterium]